ncbi:hypothetical protein ABIA32_004148 [Streptacidiphilus sp. MAP12-20]|uniref:hypothetical protein n=1 Tax=Streptacidiphilus sp. MAP12-20 TaxID=3156299 RepID=UPI0035160CF3
MAAHQSKKLRRGAEDLLRRTGMASMPAGAEWTPMPGAGSAAPIGNGPMTTAFAHHASGEKRGRAGSALAAAHDLLPGHRHRGAEQHSALSGGR